METPMAEAPPPAPPVRPAVPARPLPPTREDLIRCGSIPTADSESEDNTVVDTPQPPATIVLFL